MRSSQGHGASEGYPNNAIRRSFRRHVHEISSELDFSDQARVPPCIPGKMATNVDRGVQADRFRLGAKQRLAAASDAAPSLALPPMMRATDWEFRNRAVIFGLIFGAAFALYAVDPQNVTVVLSSWLGAALHRDADSIARLIFFCAAALLAAAALIRTWASAYLQATVVYAADVNAGSLVADGPYRRVRNPLYFANVLLAFGMGAMMSRLGFVVGVAAMLLFCYRLILREEAELTAAQGTRYERYLQAVPRLWPALSPRIGSAGQTPRWAAGFKSELWCWGYAAAVLSFAGSLDLRIFYAVLGLSLLLFWVGSWLARRKHS